MRVKSSSQAGNIFFALFGAVALVGILGAGVMTFMKGPLATSVKVTRINTAETQMNIGAQVAVMAAANTASSGDCDSDGYVEPLEWRDAGASPKPTGGGLIPMSIGIAKKDPWGTEYGYCAWDHGSSGVCDDETGAGDNPAERLEGDNDSGTYAVVALISAGPDKTFTTTCRNFSTADVNADGDLEDAGDLPLVSKAAETDDDIIFTYTYEEATGASGGLWSIKSGSPDTAVINKKIETTGTASFAGGVLLPDSSLITCDATTAGVMARNASGTGIEICDGSGWTAISGGSSSGGIGLSLDNGTATPNVSSGMDVDGTCGTATCYSTQVVFTLTNNLGAPSDPLVTSLSNTINFEFVSDNCNGNVIASGASCQMVVRAKASGNVSYAATLNVIGNNSPLATLDGTATNFAGCNVGGNAPGGYYVACSISGYDWVITPSGCTAPTSNPTCAGGADTETIQASVSNPYTVAGMSHTVLQGSGEQNTANMVAYQGGSISFPAASWCSSLSYGGYDDWFLPSLSELQSYFYPNQIALGSAGETNKYWGSTAYSWTSSSYRYYTMRLSDGSGQLDGGNASYYYRCMRKTPASTVTPMSDTTPYGAVQFTPVTVTTAGQTITSDSIIIYAVTEPITISVSGGTNAKFSKNGGSYTSTPTTATNGDTIRLRASSPVAGTEDIISLLAGSSTFTWKLRTSSNSTIRTFTSKNTIGNGAFGSVGTADSFCTTAANVAGLGGNWVAVMVSQDLEQVVNRLPWDWQRLENMNGQVVATGVDDFLDGTITAPMNIAEDTTIPAASQVWTGMDSTGIGNQYLCSGWGSGSGTGSTGDTASTSGGGYFKSWTSSCADTRRVLCMETIGSAGADGDPDPVYVAPGISYSSGGTATSNTVSVTGIVGTIMITITPNAGTADIIKNGVSVGATTTLVSNGDTIAFTLTTPATAGQKNTATLTFGPDSYSWWAGYADNSNIGMIFPTSQTYAGGAIGGLTGADSKCQSLATAAGLNGTWKAILSDSTTNAIDRIPFNFGEIRRTDQAVLANDWASFWSGGALNAPINLDENKIPRDGEYVFTGSDAVGLKLPIYNTGNDYCIDWTSSSSYNVKAGRTDYLSTGQWLISGTGACFNSERLYCMASLTPAQNDKPASVNILPKVTTSSGARITSDTITISGISTSITASISASGGTPRLKVNGGSEVASASVSNGDSIEFLLDAPTVTGTKQTATITLGGDTYSWWVGYADSTKTGRIFITSSTYTGALGGLSGADAKCDTLANAAGWGTGWTAVLSSSSVNAIDRVPFNWGVLKTVNDNIVANTWSDLWGSSSLVTYPNITQASATKNSSAHTGTDQYGMYIGENCLDYSSASGTDSSAYGKSNNYDKNWIENTTGSSCSLTAALYCMKVP